MKYDKGKTDLSLMPPEALADICKVLEFGAQKYGRNNWRDDGDSTPWSRSYASIQRHLNAYWSGEDIDPESGQRHLAHAACQCIILMVQQDDGHSAMDDRYKKKDTFLC